MFLRNLLLSGLLTTAVLLAAQVSSAQVVTTPAPIPNNQVNLSDFGGVPGAGRTAIASAFSQAFAKLKSMGGGTLNIAPGTYDYGSVTSQQYMVYASDLNNILIKGYGAKFTITSANTYVLFFGFLNSNNLTVAGLTFYDASPIIGQDQTGALCVDLLSSKPTAKFKMVDIKGEHVFALFRSYAGTEPGYAYTGTEWDIHGSLTEGYYGMIVNYNGRFSKANITVHNVRRAFISYGTRDWDLTINASSTGVRGSDGLVDLIPLPSFPVQDNKVLLNFTGSLNYSALIHFYNQNSPNGLTGDTYTRNVRAHVNLTNVTPDFNKSIFYHGFGGASTTTRPFENIYLSGTVNSAYKPLMISSPAVSTAPTSSVYVSKTLSTFQNMSTLPSYFHVIPDWDLGTTPTPNPTTTTTMPPVTTTTMRPPATTTLPPTTTTLPPTTTTTMPPSSSSCTQVAMSSSEMRLETGLSYIVTKNFGTPADARGTSTRSLLRVFENGIEVGPAHSSHADIRNLGSGRFSHWLDSGGSEALRFSSTNKTDPRSNGRKYTYCIGGTTTTTMPPVTTTTLPSVTTTTLRPTTTTTMPPVTTTTLPPAPVPAPTPSTATIGWPLQSIPMGTPPLLSTQAMPGYLQWITDSGTTSPYTASGTPVAEITRISDAAAFNLPGNTFFKQSYASLQAWNSDESFLLISVPGSTGSYGALLDGKTFKWIKNVGSWASGGRWSNTNPRIFYWQNWNGSLMAQDVVSNTSTVVKSFASLGYVGASHIGWMGGTGNQDMQDRFFPMDLQKSNGSYDVVIYDRINDTIAGVVPLAAKPGVNDVMDSWGMSPSGKFVWFGGITGDGITLPRRTNIFTTDGKYLRSSPSTSSHVDYGYDANGNEVMFYISPKLGNNDKTGQTWRLDGSQGQQTTTQFTDMVGYNFHVSLQSTSKPGWAIVSSFGSSTPSSYNKFPMWNHTFAVKLDGSGKIAPIASTHHTNGALTVGDYNRQPQATPNRTLTNVLWGGTWGDTDTAGPIHSFIARPRLAP
jgi:hypothetical protein